MKIQGLQKLTLLDFPGKMACTLFTGGCNFQCPFCQNGELVFHTGQQSQITQEELYHFLEKRRSLLDGVCISGGEPLMHPEIEELAKKVKEKGFAVKIDTNGSYPQRLIKMVREGLVDYVAMDIKNAQDKYAQTAGVANLDLSPILQSVAFLLSDQIDYEFRTTVVKEFHTIGDFEKIGDWLKGARRYFLQQFVDSDCVIQAGLHACSLEEMKAFQAVLSPQIPHTYIRGI